MNRIKNNNKRKSCTRVSNPSRFKYKSLKKSSISHHETLSPFKYLPTSPISILSPNLSEISIPFTEMSNNQNNQQWQGLGNRNNNNHGHVGGGGGPCGACKYLRRKCIEGCVFAPYFDSEQGTAHFAAVHKVFGASNASKLLLRIPAHRRLDAVVTLCYEALSRVRDPIYGCVSHIFTLQQQVFSPTISFFITFTLFLFGFFLF